MASPAIKAVLILDAQDGSRVHAKYFDAGMKRDAEGQSKFERSLFGKMKGNVARSENDIVMLNRTVSVYRNGIDVIFVVVGSASENELVLSCVLEGLYDALSGMLRSQIDRRNLLENMELVFLAVDELVDGGLIMETDPVAIANRVLMRDAEGEVAMSELTISQAMAAAKQQISGFRGKH